MCCSKPMLTLELEYCQDCIKSKKLFKQGGSLWKHQGDVKGSIYRFKYNNHRIYAKAYAHLIVTNYKHLLVKWKADALIAVPIHSSRRRKRGYNQAGILTTEIQKEINNTFHVGIIDISDSMKRVKSTGYQKELDNRERKLNMQSVFRLKGNIKVPEKVIIVDDIYTTGATVNEIAKVLLKNGAKEVYFLTISIGQGF